MPLYISCFFSQFPPEAPLTHCIVFLARTHLAETSATLREFGFGDVSGRYLENHSTAPESCGVGCPRLSAGPCPGPLPGRCQCQAALPKGTQPPPQHSKSSRSRTARSSGDTEVLKMGTNRSTNLLKKYVQN